MALETHADGPDEEVLRSLQEAMNHSSSFLNDVRTAPTDMLGYLADFQIRQVELLAWAEKIRTLWPEVQSVECGLRLGNRVYLAIRIDPYSDERARFHWQLADWIQSSYPRTRDFIFYFLPPASGDKLSTSTRIYPL